MWKNGLLRFIFYWPVRIFGRCHAKPIHPQTELAINPDVPVVYVLETNSISDALTLEKLSRKKHLPNPFTPLSYQKKILPRATCLKKVQFFTNKNLPAYEYLPDMQQWVQCCIDNKVDIQVLAVTIIWSRNPGHEGEKNERGHYFSALGKFFRVLFFGADNVTVLSGPISLQSIIKHPNKANPVEVLARACQMHFDRRRKEVIGPKLPNRQQLIEELLHSTNIKNAIQAKAEETKTDIAVVEKEAYGMLNEIVANTSYHLLRFISYILHLIWNKLYHGIKIQGAARVRELVRSGHEIVYIPCHRSHMDYLLLLYTLFHEGLVVPHVAAGNNLNFIPVSWILPRCGAFFMRRKFKGDALYTAVFREYLCTLFLRGYSTEFYIEGGRSRTGRTLPPRTGIVAMAVQTQLRGEERPITFIPTYLGYEKVMEVSSYMNELQGAKKTKENAWQLLNIFKRFKYYGRGYVGFGEPISLPTFLRDNIKNWRDDISPTGLAKPEWLFRTVNALSDEIVMRLNAAAAVNGFNLCALAILSTWHHRLLLKDLQRVLSFYLYILRSSPVVPTESLPDVPANVLLKQALELRPFHLTHDQGKEIAYPSPRQVIYLTYFRNNILHYFALPALIATIIIVHRNISYEDIVTHTRNVFYFLRHELFVPVREDVLNKTIKEYLSALQLGEYITIENNLYALGKRDRADVILLSNCIHSNLVRYIVGCIVVNNIADNTSTVEEFIEQCVKTSQDLPMEITDNSPEFADPVTFRVMTETFIKHNYIYINETDKTFHKNPQKISKLINAVGPLLPNAVLQSIGFI